MPADATIGFRCARKRPRRRPRDADAPREQPARPPREQPEQPAREQPERPVERSSEPEKAPQSPRRRWLRWALFALLPLALIAGGYWYVTGGRVMSTDDAYVEADKVGISTDVSGIVKEIDVNEQPARRRRPGSVPPRRSPVPARAGARRRRRSEIVANDLNALKANYRDMQAQIKQAQHDVDYYRPRIPTASRTSSAEQRRLAGRPSTRRAGTCRTRSRSSPRSISSSPRSPPTSTATPISRSSSTRAISMPWRSATRPRASSTTRS